MYSFTSLLNHLLTFFYEKGKVLTLHVLIACFSAILVNSGITQISEYRHFFLLKIDNLYLGAIISSSRALN